MPSTDHSPAAQETPGLPPDVDPNSRFRLPVPKPEDLDELGRTLLDRQIRQPNAAARGAAGPGVGVTGPGGIQLYSPKYAERAQALNWYLRFESGLSGRTRELAILVVAREMDNQFEWTGHEPMALREGLEPQVIDVVRNRASTAGLKEEDAVVIALGREAFGDRKVSPETFARAKALFGPRKLVDLTALMGEYASVAVLLTVFDMQLLPGWRPTLPAR